MKITTKHLLLGALCLFPLLFWGCKGEPSCPEERVDIRYIIDDERMRIPYHGFDTLRFLNSSVGDESYFGVGIRQKFSEKKTRDPNPDCGIFHTEKNEVIEFTYLNTHKTDSLFLQLDNAKGTCTFVGNNCTFYYSVYAVKKLDTKVDSMLIGTKWYYNQTTLVNQLFDTLIFNKENGVLKCTNHQTGKYIAIN